MQKPKIIVVSGHCILREGMWSVLDAVGAFAVVSFHGTASDAVGLVKSHSADALVLDCSDSDGRVATISTIAKLSDGPKIVVFNALADVQHAIHALEAGAVGYLTSASSSAELVEAIQTVLHGDTFVTPSISTMLIAALRTAALRKASAAKVKLTVREEQIVSLLHKGKTNREISLVLDLSEKTVKQYMTVLMHKLAARSRLEVVLALKEFDSASRQMGRAN